MGTAMSDLAIKQAIIGVGASMFDLYLFQIIYGAFWKKRDVSNIMRLAFSVFLIGSSFIAAMWRSYTINVVWGLLLYIMAAWFYKNKIRERILLASLYFIISNGVDNISGFLLSFAFKKEFSYLLQSSIIFYLCGVIISRMLLYTAVKIIRIFKLHNLTGFSLGEITPVILLPISSIMVAFTMMQMTKAIDIKNMELSVSIILLLLTVSDIYVIYLVGKQSELQRAKQRLIFLEEQNREQIAYYQSIYENQQQVRKIRHDMKNIMLGLSGMLEEKNLEGAWGYLSNLNGRLEAGRSFIETGITSLDAVISAKQKQAEEGKIEFIFHATAIKLEIDEIDFCILVANALDNALEAANRIGTGEKREIILKIQQTEAYIIVEVRNPFVMTTSADNHKTIKKDAANHGFGIKNMTAIAEKYDGDFSISEEEINGNLYLFIVNILLKNR